MKRAVVWVAGFILVAVLGGLADAGEKPKKVLTKKYGGKTLYLQHNLALYNGSAHWWNYIGTVEFLPLGTPVALKSVSSDELVLETEDGRSVEIACDEVRPSLVVVAERIFGTTPPSMEELTAAEREAIEAARVEIGMSRRAVFMAIGYPPFFASSRFIDRKMITNPDLDDPELIWIKKSNEVLAVTFEGDTVVSIGE